jgi:hypothetical protein
LVGPFLSFLKGLRMDIVLKWSYSPVSLFEDERCI